MFVRFPAFHRPTLAVLAILSQLTNAVAIPAFTACSLGPEQAGSCPPGSCCCSPIDRAVATCCCSKLKSLNEAEPAIRSCCEKTIRSEPETYRSLEGAANLALRTAQEDLSFSSSHRDQYSVYSHSVLSSDVKCRCGPPTAVVASEQCALPNSSPNSCAFEAVESGMLPISSVSPLRVVYPPLPPPPRI